jgi:hypothetical protein
MSAYICDNKTISAIVEGVLNYGGRDYEFKAEGYKPATGWLIDLNEQRKAIGQALLEQNYRSVNYCYDENEPTPKFTFEEVKINPSIVVGCIRNYEYQACETPDYYETELHKSLERLKTCILYRVCEQHYGEMPWGYPDDTPLF